MRERDRHTANMCASARAGEPTGSRRRRGSAVNANDANANAGANANADFDVAAVAVAVALPSLPALSPSLPASPR